MSRHISRPNRENKPLTNYGHIAGVRPTMSTGRIVSTINRLFGQAGTQNRPYECRECLERFEVQYHSCPECGSYRVNRVTWAIE